MGPRVRYVVRRSARLECMENRGSHASAQPAAMQTRSFLLEMRGDAGRGKRYCRRAAPASGAFSAPDSRFPFPFSREINVICGLSQLPVTR
jgi:hypothetical protein